MMKVLAISTLFATTASANEADPTRAIEFLKDLQSQKPSSRIDLTDPEAFRNSMPPTMTAPKMEIKEWAKYKAGEKFKFRVKHSLPPLDGFNFEVTQMSCQVQHITPSGGDFGQEDMGSGFVPAISYGQTGLIESAKPQCVNGFVCQYEVVIKEIASSPDGRFLFGPYIVAGKEGPFYDCFLEAIDLLQ